MVQRALLIVSVLSLLYLAFLQGLVAYIYMVGGAMNAPIGAITGLAYVASMALFFATSYRQIRVRRPKLVALCIIMLIVSNMLAWLSLYLFQQDTAAQTLNDEMNKLILEGLKNSEAARNNSEILAMAAPQAPGYLELAKDLGFSLLLMIIPAYVNFRPRHSR